MSLKSGRGFVPIILGLSSAGLSMSAVPEDVDQLGLRGQVLRFHPGLLQMPQPWKRR